MNIEIIGHQHQLLRCGIIHIDQLLEFSGKTACAAILIDHHLAPATQWFTHQQQVGAPLAKVFIILTEAAGTRLVWLGGQGCSLWSGGLQFLALFIQADHRIARVIRPLIDFQHSF